MKRLWFVLLLFLCPRLPAQTPPWSGILATSRAIDWSTAGVTGGIPSASWAQCVTSACATVSTNGPSSTAAQINAAVSSAPTNTYVLLPAGTYNLSSQISISHSKVALRGAGANQTLLVFTGGSPSMNLIGNGLGNTVLVSGTIPQGATTVVLASVSGLVVGSPIMFDQTDSLTDDGGVLVLGSSSSYTGPFTAPGNGGPYSEDGGANGIRCASTNDPSGCYHQQQMPFVTSCNGVATVGTACTGTGVTVGINPPIHMSNWATANGMAARWATSPMQYAGVEDLSIDNTNNSGSNNLNLTNCSNCWVKGIRSVDEGGISHLVVTNGANDSIVNSYFFLTQAATTGSYGVNCTGSSDLRVENNIFQAVVSPIVMNGSCNGSVFGYNFDVLNYYVSSQNYGENFWGQHSGGVDTNLIEGNIANYTNEDNIHGTSNLDTFFRNVMTGPMADCWASGSPYLSATFGPCTNATTPMYFFSYHRFMNVIGNVLGTTGVNTAYEASSSSTANASIYAIGYGNGGPPSDPNVLTTIMLWGNADSATGFGLPRFNCGEVPTSLTVPSQSPYSNPCPATHTLPASFYYSSTPSWWPSGKRWPIIGPDVTGGNILICSGGTQARALVTSSSQCPSGTTAAGMNSLASSNPAMDCYLSLGGLPHGTGPDLTNFNESSCYAETVSSNPPEPPTDLTATVD